MEQNIEIKMSNPEEFLTNVELLVSSILIFEFFLIFFNFCFINIFYYI
jgi:hypothetical protein